MHAYNFGSSGYNLTKFYQGMWLIAGVITWTLVLQGCPPTILRWVKNVKNSARFVTTFDFDRKYLRLIEHGFTSAPTQYRLYGRRFLQVWWPNQQCQCTEGGWLVIQTGLNLTMLTSPCYNTTTCMQILHKKIIQHTQSNLSTVSELSEMKPNLVD